MQKYEVEMQN